MPDQERYKHLNVLVVDDVFNVRTMLKNMLRQLGFSEMVEAGSGQEAVEKLVQEVVDLVMCDWNMPGMKGIDVLRFVRGRPETANLPFIMVTGEMSEAVVAEAAETDVDAYLIKPFNLQQLQRSVSQVLVSHKELSAIDQHLERGRSYITTRQFDRAHQEFKAALAVNPKSPRTLLEIGKLYQERGNDTRAKEFFGRALHFQPKFLRAHEALAELYLALGDKENHLKHLEAASRISPRNLERRLLLGEAMMNNGKADEARELFKQILEDASKQYSEIAERVGDALMSLGAFEVAEQAFAKALDGRPGNLHLFNQLGIAYRRQRKFDQAISNYQQALRIAPDDENLYYNLALAYDDSGQKAKAAKSVAKALKINPKLAEAHELAKKLKTAA